ncbi:Na(+)-translocating ferredoxin:NAD(+) oxidoreductase complex subunit G [Eubacterium plexicaudatum ASF492]|uniref:Ion-translocating oxidoreductase complex subunit G n=1 Tax=Eubacterium plexicaudatum ASF492 TaxID=1235802 RepID=N2B8K5_9FIRM|nr:Na(+)-translocating ferredoxin:NAD(+) oxidoreductase complex subunit G [Eubacterium plexicaudatum ASF492]
MKNKIIHDAIVLTIITIVAGFLLGLVHDITLEPIAKATFNKQQAAYRNVFADAASFEEYADFDADAATKAAIDAGFENDLVEGAQVALDASGNPLGYVITVTSTEGSQANITLSMGVTMEGVLNGYETTSISETPGLGSKVSDADFKSQFEGKSVETFTVTKTGASSDSEIDALSGATISTRAVTNAVNAGLAYFRSIGGGN